ncbi:primase-helicase family protein [Pseudomonas benzopyrenica]|uniref:primase-helicase family protein n=1 Tax=Pseudomonas benzopyrenica TaxID=2993566 RepID=UPI003F164B4C
MPSDTPALTLVQSAAKPFETEASIRLKIKLERKTLAGLRSELASIEAAGDIENVGAGYAAELLLDQERLVAELERKLAAMIGAPFDTRARIWTLDEMVAELVWIERGSQVASLTDSKMFLDFKEFRMATAASKAIGEDGRMALVADLWRASPDRHRALTRTFHAGHGAFTFSPSGESAVNTWRQPIHADTGADVTPFLEQVSYLFGSEADKFLDWLAHLAQRPGELPHYGWLHVAPSTGTGRSWLGDLLCEVWKGYAAPDVDLAEILNSDFNGELAGCVLAVVPEAKSDDASARVTESKLRRIVNPATRKINPKYGRAFIEHNACRWLVFSNHLDAIPISQTDRRFWVASCSAEPRSPEVYSSLYRLKADSAFVSAVGHYLATRNIDGFNHGETPPATELKRAAIRDAKSDIQNRADDLAEQWPSDVITRSDAAAYLSAQEDGARWSAQMRRVLNNSGGGEYAKPVKVAGRTCEVYILRNADKWRDAAGLEIARECLRAREVRCVSPTSSALDVMGAEDF